MSIEAGEEEKIGRSLSEEVWRLLRRIAIVYAALYILPFPLVDANGGGLLAEWSATAWGAVVRIVGATVLGIPDPSPGGGSSDTTWHWIQNGLMLSASLVVGAVWWLVTRRRPGDDRALAAWARVLVRYFLGITLLGYGFAKVFEPRQFGHPNLVRLDQPLGESSPMGLLWTFMGHSTPYQVFGGLAEVVAGLLLFARRTTLLGALIGAGVMLNVVMMNFCYDVGVKLFATNVFLMLTALTVPDGRRLLRFFILGRSVESRVEELPLPPWRFAIIGKNALKLAYIAFFVYSYWSAVAEERELYADFFEADRPLMGIYQVDRYARAGAFLPTEGYSGDRWRRVVFDEFGNVTVRTMQDTVTRLRANVDEQTHTIELVARDGDYGRLKKGIEARFTYRPEVDGQLLLTGTWQDGTSVTALLRPVNADALLLNARGFRLVTEVPLNR